MLGGIVASLGGKLLDGIFGTVDEMVEDKDLANQIKAKLQTKVLGIVQTEIKAARDIIVAEINSGSWLAANWRPLLMVLFGVIIANNFIIVPIFNTPSADIPPDMWDLLKLGVGGYVVGRTAEKSLKTWKGQD